MVRLQQFGHQESRYERPNQKWVCGRHTDGRQCRVGPDSRGRCTATAESHCSPRRDGDRWMCARPEPFGGPCANGPRPDGSCANPPAEHPLCQPRLSIRARRSRVTVVTGLAVIGILIAWMAGPWSATAVSPGPLSSSHASIASLETGAESCAVCHKNFTGQPLRWLSSLIEVEGHEPVSTACLDCHFSTEGQSSQFAAEIHSLNPEWIRERTAHADHPSGATTFAVELASLLDKPTDRAGGSPLCVQCHQEHRGRDHNLLAVGDATCQVCHRTQFASLSDGHPEFHGVMDRGGGIAFDHASHQAHFGEREFDCSSCHESGPSRLDMVTRPYESSCLGCHNQGRPDHHGEGIRASQVSLITLPELELEEETNWPTSAGDPEEPLPPLMLLLIAGDTDETASTAFMEFVEQADGVPFDWEPEDPAQLSLLAEAIKRLVQELDHGETSALQNRVAHAAGLAPDHPAVVDFVRALSQVQFAAHAMQSQWLDEPASDGIKSPKQVFPEPSAGWSIDDSSVALTYSPRGHADELYRALTNLLMARARAGDPESDSGMRAFTASQFDVIREELTSSKLGGPLYSSCLRCHTTSDAGSGAMVHWRAAGRDPQAVGYGRFNHEPHLVLMPGEAGCVRCHRLGEAGGEARESAETPCPGGFLPHRRSDCASCHHSGGAQDGCLTCHVYHFNRP